MDSKIPPYDRLLEYVGDLKGWIESNEYKQMVQEQEAHIAQASTRMYNPQAAVYANEQSQPATPVTAPTTPSRPSTHTVPQIQQHHRQNSSPV